MSRYHASTWSLLLAPHPLELLAFLHADYDLSPTADDSELSKALVAAGHGLTTAYAQEVACLHRAARYERLTGDPF